jgi:tetratricopeptide (TPR) repeat protein
VVEGSVLFVGKDMRITLQVVDGKSEKSLLTREYKGDRGELLVLESELAKDIALEIQAKWTVGAKPRRLNPEAYLTYQYGRGQWNKRTADGVQQAIGYYQKAIALDPTFAPAYAGLADAWALFGSAGTDAAPPNQSMPQAKAAALKAVELDAGMAEGHASLAYVYLSYDWDLPAAAREFQRAIALNPGYATAHHWYAHYWLAAGNVEQALAEAGKALQLDPLSIIINTSVGWCLYHGRRYPEAIEQYRNTLKLDDRFAVAHCALGMALVQERQFAAADAEFDRALELGDTPAFALAAKASTYGLAGKRPQALATLARLQGFAADHYVPALYFAAVYGELGQRDRSLSYLQKAYEERAEYLLYLRSDPWFTGLLADEQFRRILQLMRTKKL